MDPFFVNEFDKSKYGTGMSYDRFWLIMFNYATIVIKSTINEPVN